MALAGPRLLPSVAGSSSCTDTPLQSKSLERIKRRRLERETDMDLEVPEEPPLIVLAPGELAPRGAAALLTAVLAGEDSLVCGLLMAGDDANACDEHGVPAIQLARARGYAGIAAALLRHGAVPPE